MPDALDDMLKEEGQLEVDEALRIIPQDSRISIWSSDLSIRTRPTEMTKGRKV